MGAVPSIATMSEADKAAWVKFVTVDLGVSSVAGSKGERGVKGDKGDNSFSPASVTYDTTAGVIEVSGTTADHMFRVGNSVRTDFAVKGASTDLVWDASANSLKNGTLMASFYPSGNYDTSSTDGGAISLTSPLTLIDGAAGQTRTMAAGTVPGQMKTLWLAAQASGLTTVTLTGNTIPASLALSTVGQSVTFMWTGSKWTLVGRGGAAFTITN